MNINKQMLETRLTIVMVRENYTFLNTISNFKIKLKELFNVDYSEDEIENALHELEEAYIVHEFEREQQEFVEHEEDY
jgi:hypothetical protein